MRGNFALLPLALATLASKADRNPPIRNWANRTPYKRKPKLWVRLDNIGLNENSLMTNNDSAIAVGSSPADDVAVAVTAATTTITTTTTTTRTATEQSSGSDETSSDDLVIFSDFAVEPIISSSSSEPFVHTRKLQPQDIFKSALISLLVAYLSYNITNAVLLNCLG